MGPGMGSGIGIRIGLGLVVSALGIGRAIGRGSCINMQTIRALLYKVVKLTSVAMPNSQIKQ